MHSHRMVCHSIEFPPIQLRTPPIYTILGKRLERGVAHGVCGSERTADASGEPCSLHAGETEREIMT